MHRIVLTSMVCGLLSAVLVNPATAANASLVTYVERVSVTADDVEGGCLAKLFEPPQNTLPGCGADWVSFDCTGEINQPLRAYRMLDQAQLAVAGGHPVEVWFSDDFRFGGYCYVYRIDVLEQP